MRYVYLAELVAHFDASCVAARDRFGWHGWPVDPWGGEVPWSSPPDVIRDYLGSDT